VTKLSGLATSSKCLEGLISIDEVWVNAGLTNKRSNVRHKKNSVDVFMKIPHIHVLEGKCRVCRREFLKE